MASSRTVKATFIVGLLLVSSVPLTILLAAPEGEVPIIETDFDLIARRTSSPPVIDGDVDAAWDGARVLEAFVTGDSGAIFVDMRAMFDDDYVYLLASWDEPQFPEAPRADVERDAWQLIDNSTPGGTWDHKDWGEDRLSFFFEDPDSPVENFASQGCDGICHDLVEMYTLNAGEMLDAWVWSAASTNPTGYADDGVLLNNNTVDFDPQRMHVTVSDLDWDDGADGWWVNNDTANATERPTHVWKAGAMPGDPRFMTIDDAQAVDWSTFDASTIPQGTFVPGSILMTPTGDRADVQAKGVHNGTGWNVEFKRLRDTGSPDDVAFDETNVAYNFAPAITNNRTGDKHSKGIHEYHLWLAEPVQPDLEIGLVRPSGVSWTVNSTVNVYAYVDNIGWADSVPGKLSYHWEVLGAPSATEVDLPAVPWGETMAVEFNASTADLPPGNNTLILTVDSQDAVVEIDEMNNGANITLLLDEEALPNLVADVMGMDPADPPVDAYVEVSVAVVNAGSWASPAATIVLYLDDIGDPIVTGTLPSIDQGDSDLWQYTWGPVGLPVGHYVLNVTVDPDDEVRESDETDNTLSLPFNVTEPTLPDLVVTEVTPLNTTVEQGQETRTRVVVENVGGAPVTDDFQVGLFLNEAFTVGTVGLVGTADVTDDIPVGGNATVVVIWTVPGDTPVGSDGFVRAQVDWLRAIDELDDGNNNATYHGLVVTRRSLPDLTVTTVVPMGPTVKLETRITFTITVSNVGSKDSSTTTTLLVKDTTNNKSLDSLVVPELASDGHVDLSYEWFVSGVEVGTVTIQFLVDPLNHIVEEDEFNNVLNNQVTVRQADLPDLTIPEGGISFFPLEPRIGEAVTISVSVENLGTNATPETTIVEVRLGNNRIATADLLTLGAGESRTLDIPWSASGISTPMEYTLLFTVDPDNTIRELDNSNNAREAKITFVKAPEAILENLQVTASAQKVEDGKSVTITVSIDNVGNKADSVSIVLKDGVTEVDSAQVTVPANGSKSQTFDLKLTGTGDHTITATVYRGGDVVKDPSGDDMTDSVTVKVTEASDDGDGLGLMVIVIVVVIVIAVVAVAYVFMGRK